MRIEAGTAAIVTGGASGLGEATARALAARGAKVALFDLARDKGEAVARDIGGIYCEVDVASEASVDAGLARARAAHGQERVLVSCAGIVIGQKTAFRDKATGAFKAHEVAAFTKVMMVNLVGSFQMLAKCAAGMAALEPVTPAGERGVIVNTASIAAEEGQIGQVAYAASKAGVVGMTLPAARDLAREGIRVCTIMPGLFLTPMSSGLPDETLKALAANVPFPPKLGEPAEFAALACHIVENEMFNGASIRLDGALRMQPK